MRSYITMLWRSFVYLHRSPVNIFDLVLWPLMLVVPFGLFARYTTSDPTVLTILIVGAIGWVTTSSVQRELSVNFMIEVWQRTIKKARVLPISDFTFVTGNWVVGIVRGLITFGIISSVAYFLFGVNVFKGDFLILVTAMAGIFISGLMIGMFVVSVVKILGHRADAIAWFITDILVAVSGIYYSVSILPAWMQRISYISPLTYIFESLRQSLVYGAGFSEVAHMFAKMFMIQVVLLVMMGLFYRYAEEKAIERGFYQRYG